MIWIYHEDEEDGEKFWILEQILEEFNPDPNMLAGMYPEAIYFSAELVME